MLVKIFFFEQIFSCVARMAFEDGRISRIERGTLLNKQAFAFKIFQRLC